jgi:23S rRNA (pseudouridine1915-N3)-methyltransferase
MKIRLLMIGKTAFSYLDEGMELYTKRLVHYSDLTVEIIPDVKRTASTTPDKLKDLEAEAFLKKIGPRDAIVLLDENGKTFSSEKFAVQVQKWMQAGDKNIVFIIGGAFGFGDALYERALMKISLSEMTFSHQMVRLIFLEQLYRAFTIIKNEPYHHK